MYVFSPGDLADNVLATYSRTGFKPPDGKFTVLAAFSLWDARSNALKVISMATGSKCLPEARLCAEGDALHDSHAEVLSRRGAVRWFLEETYRVKREGAESPWIHEGSNGKYTTSASVRIVMYISAVPCGDASMRYLAAFQDEEMAALKNSTQFSVLPSGAASRGRDNYSLLGVLRTKPGRADSPPTLSMSCSDKIARWNVLGLQGALASLYLEPLYVDDIVIGEVPEELQPVVLEDCQRAFWGRLASLHSSLLPPLYRLQRPGIHFVSIPFVHSKTSLRVASSCNDSLCWVSDSETPSEVLINGIRRGVPPKHRHKPKFRPILSKISLFNLFRKLEDAQHHHTDDQTQHNDCELTYHEVKETMSTYQDAKAVLLSQGCPFSGWIQSGAKWENFDINGVVHSS
ncbi:adenosine deaminase/editase [Panus rudis PR-1116 ss-1]|nr:adenosine deaminase/editase [Panus rudis PR-1116 ss-1]